MKPEKEFKEDLKNVLWIFLCIVLVAGTMIIFLSVVSGMTPGGRIDKYEDSEGDVARFESKEEETIINKTNNCFEVCFEAGRLINDTGGGLSDKARFIIGKLNQNIAKRNDKIDRYFWYSLFITIAVIAYFGYRIMNWNIKSKDNYYGGRLP